MIRQRLSIAITAVLLSLQAVLPITAKAGDLTAPDGRGLSTNTDDFRVPNSAAAAQSTEDEASRLSDLESLARRNGPPALSLSVSGWVGEQVIHTVNH